MKGKILRETFDKNLNEVIRLKQAEISEIVLQVYKYGIKQTILTNGILLENIIFLLITKSHTDCNMATVVALIKCQCLLKKANFYLL